MEKNETKNNREDTRKRNYMSNYLDNMNNCHTNEFASCSMFICDIIFLITFSRLIKNPF